VRDVHRPTGPVLFASGPHDPRARRPTDLALALTSVLAIVVTSVASQIGGDVDAALAAALSLFPPFLDPLWSGLAWAPLIWAVILLGTTVLRRRTTLARDLIGAVAVAIGLAVLVGAVVTDDPWAPLSRLGDVGGPPAFPPGALTIAAAVLAVASPHLSRPFRHLGRWLLAGSFVGTMILGAANPSGTVVALAVGTLAAAIIHLTAGSPGGRPTLARVQLALQGLGVEAHELTPPTMHAGGVVRCSAVDAMGPLDIKVYGRDAWDAQLLATVWRLAWYRGPQRTVRLTRLELVEHEGFVTLLAERAGVRVPPLVTAGAAGQGDALVVVRSLGRPLTDMTTATDEAFDAFWAALGRLHAAGIAHHRLDLDRIVQGDDGALAFGDLSSAFVAETVADRRRDEAQALALGMVVVGEARAVASARRALGDDGVLAALPYLQAAALPGGIRDALDAAGVDLDDARNRVRTTLGAPEQQLVKLRRVTLGSLLNLGLLAVAAYALIAAFGGMDLDDFADALRDASWWWLAFALVLAQIPRFPSAVSTMGSLEHPLPFGPLAALQFAICYVNLAIPSTAARVAINVRFFQRLGVTPATSMTAGAIDSVSGFVVQIAIFLVLFLGSDLDLGLSSDLSASDGLATLVLVVLGVVLLAIVIVVAVAPLRRRVVAMLRQAATALRVLRSPTKLLLLFGGNLVSQVLFAVAFAAVVEAFHTELPLSQLLLINTVVSLFAGLLPVPGGIGVSEAGLTLGLTTAGVPSETAFAIALAYRMVSFYLPPIWGALCYRWLVRRRYL